MPMSPPEGIDPAVASGPLAGLLQPDPVVAPSGEGHPLAAFPWPSKLELLPSLQAQGDRD